MKHLFYLILLIFLASCSTTNESPLGEYTLKVKEPIEFDSGLKLEITLVEDSRCPLDAICVWAGEAVVTFNVEEGENQETLQLGKCGSTSPQCIAHTTDELDYRFSLLDVTPFPELDVEVDESELQIRINVIKL